MIFLYTLLVGFLGLAKFVTNRRARQLEKKYARTARAVDELARQTPCRDSTNSKSDACQLAKRQYLLGQLAQKRDRLEARHEAWEERSDRLGRWVTCVRNWKGKKLPYTLGVVDVSLVLYLIDQFGVGNYVSFRSLAQTVTSLVSNG